jgi:hypothetical protein
VSAGAPLRASAPASALGGSRRRRLCASLLAGLFIQIPAGHSMAATTPSTPERRVAHCTGRFDYALPAALQSSGSQQSLYRLKVEHEPWPATLAQAAIWQRRLAATLSGTAASAAAAGRAREFDLPGVGPAAWMQLAANRPDLVTLLAMKPIPDSGLALFLRAEGSAGREAIAQGVVTEVAKAYVPSSPQGFCAGPGAFVIQPSKNERALESYAGAGVEISIETETVAAPDDGQSTAGDPPPGSKVLAKRQRRVGGFDGIEERTQVAEDGVAPRLVYTWIFAGRAADGAAPRIRLSGAAAASRADALEAAWNALLESWRPRPVGVR